MRGIWTKLKTQPAFDPSTMLLLTGARVMCNASNSADWRLLSPDARDSDEEGTWSQLSPMKNARLYYASGILPDGRVFVDGGEYNGGDTGVELDAAEVFDPVCGQWSLSRLIRSEVTLPI